MNMQHTGGVSNPHPADHGPGALAIPPLCFTLRHETLILCVLCLVCTISIPNTTLVWETPTSFVLKLLPCMPCLWKASTLSCSTTKFSTVKSKWSSDDNFRLDLGLPLWFTTFTSPVIIIIIIDNWNIFSNTSSRFVSQISCIQFSFNDFHGIHCAFNPNYPTHFSSKLWHH